MARRSGHVAVAIRINNETIRGIILSEAGPDYSLKAAEQWYEEYGDGWFLRDEKSPLDCQFFMPDIFDTIYKFIADDDNSIMRVVKEIKYIR